MYYYYVAQPQDLQHHGILGMHWGVRRYQPYPEGYSGTGRFVGRMRPSSGGTYNKDDVVFVSGKVKFDKPITSMVKRELDGVMNAGSKIIIGDAPGADTRCQDYLASKQYDNVVVYTTDEVVRNNVGNWPVERISDNGMATERDVRAQKDIAMSNAATKGIVVSSRDDRSDSATSKNMQRLAEAGKSIQFYDYKADSLSVLEDRIKHSDDYLAHHGILGMHWGVRRYQPYPSGYTGDGKYVGDSKSDSPVAKQNVKMAAKDYKKKGKRGYQAVQELGKASTILGEEYVNKALQDEAFRKKTLKAVRNATQTIVAIAASAKLLEHMTNIMVESYKH